MLGSLYADAEEAPLLIIIPNKEIFIIYKIYLLKEIYFDNNTRALSIINPSKV